MKPEKQNEAKYWMGYITNCDICHKPFGDTMIDGATTLRAGAWANMCKHCFNTFGVGLGMGRGQRYDKQPDGRWLKVQ